MNIVFMGTPTFSVPIVEAIHKQYGVKLIVTQPDTPKGRKRTMTPSPVKLFALENKIVTFQPRRIRDDYQTIINANPDIIITAAYGQILPETLLNIPKHKAINVHASLLPELRGGAPIQRAIERGYKKTGVTILYMSKKMDEGDIISQRSIQLASNETAKTLFEKLSLLGRDLLVETMPKIFADQASRHPQDEQLATYAYNLKRAEERLDFNKSASELEAKIRAFYPEPATYTIIQGKKLKVYEAEIDNNNIPPVPVNTVFAADEAGIKVKCKQGALNLLKVQLEGKKTMSVASFMRGAGRNIIYQGVSFE